jgi:SAM-dependent methyltransferase
LHELYRTVRDETYMLEERGRRRTARRLLDLLGSCVPRGRLLQVGCGYGLLLDEARRRGYDGEGYELSVAAAQYARERLGLEVHNMAIEQADLEGERYDAVLLVDVLEHIDDPLLMLERLLAVLAPGGALLVVTPDPSSLVARVAGSRWWCYLPAHCCLIPRRTLRELILARGLRIVSDAPAVHSFTLGYWLAGLGERGGWLGWVIGQVAARLPRDLQVTASLRDERVLLARSPGPRPGGPHV